MPAKQSVSKLEDHLGYWLRFVSNHVSHAFTRKLEARSVTVAEWVVMRELLQTGATSPSMLAERLGMTRGAISKLVERLCGKELVERTYPEGDRRYQRLVLSPSGKKLVPILADLADQNDREFFGDLAPDQRAELVAILQQIVHRQGWKDVPTT